MYDFCFTPFYSVFLVLAGVYALVAKGSIISFGASSGVALLLAGLTYISFKHYKAGKQCKPGVTASLLISGAMTAMMYAKFARTQGVHLAIIGFVSGCMSSFYAWNLVAGPNPAKAKKQ